MQGLWWYRPFFVYAVVRGRFHWSSHFDDGWQIASGARACLIPQNHSDSILRVLEVADQDLVYVARFGYGDQMVLDPGLAQNERVGRLLEDVEVGLRRYSCERDVHMFA